MAEENLLIPRDVYLKHGVHIGTTSKNKDMRRFIFKVLPNGLAMLDIKMIDKRIQIAAKFLSRYNNILVASRKIKKPMEIFAKEIGATFIHGRFMPGTLTNPNYEKYIEPDVLFVSDPFIDEQAIEEALKARIPIVALCNTFNSTDYVDLVIPCNNKGRKSIALIMFLLTREILRLKGNELKLKIDDFIEQKE
ncbi:MAG: 30S ribosomal protein S2 [Candidatus Aenigmarchaeota archaeon]|nr:30S ribosomal protein S2 [Candidatus Aenigmarchaeota archaeon]